MRGVALYITVALEKTATDMAISLPLFLTPEKTPDPQLAISSTVGRRRHS